MTPERFDMAVIGGGIAGISVAYFLAKADRGRVVLLEGEMLGAGATAYSSGGVRQQFSTPLEIELSIRALAFWKSAEERFQSPCTFTETGYLFVTTRESWLERLRDAAHLQTKMGAGPAHILGPQELGELAPWLVSDDLAGGCWTPQDGRMVPADGVAAIARGARACGAVIRQNSAVCRIERIRGGFRLPIRHGVVEAETVIVAGGLSTPGLVEPLGHTVEIRPWMIHYAYTAPALTDHHLPTMIDLDLGMTVKRDGHGLNLGILDEKSNFDSTAADMLEAFFAAASIRAPSLVDVGIIRMISAAADLSVDGHPYAGQLEDGIWLLAGFGGHGTMHGPVLAEWLVDAITGADISDRLLAFDPHRTGTATDHEWMIASRKP